jgi:hypothetical protein
MVFYVVFEAGGRVAAESYAKAKGAVVALVRAGFVAWVEGMPAGARVPS